MFLCLACPIDLVFVLDSSGSIRDANVPPVDNWQLMLNFVMNIMQFFNIDCDTDRVGLVRFSSTANNEFFLNRFCNNYDAQQQVNSTGFLGTQTNMAAAFDLVTAFQFGQSKFGTRYPDPSVHQMVIVVSDGNANIPVTNTVSVTKTAAEAMRNFAQVIIAVGITNNIDESTLGYIAYPPIQNATIFTSPDFFGLSTLLDFYIQISNIRSECVPSKSLCLRARVEHN